LQYSAFNPFPWYKKMAKESPVIYDADYLHYHGPKGTWHVFRYDDVQRVMSDYQTFSNQYQPKIEENPSSSSLALSDPPRHKQLRMLVSDVFTPKTIANMRPWIEKITNELIDKIENNGEMDITRDIATPIPIQVIAKLLGVSPNDQEKFKKWSIMILQAPSEIEGGEETFLRSQQEMAQYFISLFEQRKVEPKDDLISHLLQAEVEGEKLSTNDLLGFCVLLLVAGNETTTNLISSSILTFIENPEIQEYLAKHPEDIPKAIEEVLRYRSPLQYINRIAAKDVELRGQSIKKGDLINVWLGSANRDESIFPNPDQFDIHRTNLKHTAFGHGIHFCLGAPLARLEAHVALQVIFERLHQFQLKEATEPLMNPTALTYSIKELPVTFKKR
jgi:cytochrome P450